MVHNMGGSNIMSMTLGIPMYDNTGRTEATHTMRLTAVSDDYRAGMKKYVKIYIVDDEGDLIRFEGYLDYDDIKEALGWL